MISLVIQDYDLIGLQEINDICSVDKIENIINGDFNRNFDYVSSEDISKCKTDPERFTVFFNKDIFKFQTSEIYNKIGFSRFPVYFEFKTKNNVRIGLVIFHLVWGSKKQRLAEYSKIPDAVKEFSYEKVNLFIMGDFNLPVKTLDKSFIFNEKTTIGSISAYDNIKQIGNLKVLSKEVICLDTIFFTEKTLKNCSKSLSDHRPIKIKLKVG